MPHQNIIAVSAGGCKTANVFTGIVPNLNVDNIDVICGISAGALCGAFLAMLPKGHHKMTGALGLKHTSTFEIIKDLLLSRDIHTQDEIGSLFNDQVKLITEISSSNTVELHRDFVVGCMVQEGENHSYQEKIFKKGPNAYETLYKWVISSATISGCTSPQYGMTDGGEFAPITMNYIRNMKQKGTIAKLAIVSPYPLSTLKSPQTNFPFHWLPRSIRLMIQSELSGVNLHYYDYLTEFLRCDHQRDVTYENVTKRTGGTTYQAMSLEPIQTLTTGVFECSEIEQQQMHSVGEEMATHLNAFFREHNVQF